jgi:hypothetical protein
MICNCGKEIPLARVEYFQELGETVFIFEFFDPNKEKEE